MRVRIAVRIAKDGGWAAYGFGKNGASNETDAAGVTADMMDSDPDDEHLVWVEADVPIPQTPTVHARLVTEAAKP